MKSRRKMVKSLVFVGLVLVFALSLINQSEAQQKPLKGVYAVTGDKICVGHWLVNPNNSSDTTYWTHTSSSQGTITFNGDGTGSGEVSDATIMHPIYTPIPLGSYWSSFPPSILGNPSASTVSFSFTYSVLPDRSITRTVTSAGFTGSITFGPLNGKIVQVNPITLTGFVSSDNGTILLSSIPGQEEIETTSIYNKNSDGSLSLYGTQEAECHRSRVLTLIGK